LDLFQNQIIPELENLAIENPWFQMDRAPPHSTKVITDFLHRTFADRWIGRFGPIASPPRSPLPKWFLLLELSEVESLQQCPNPKYTRAARSHTFCMWWNERNYGCINL